MIKPQEVRTTKHHLNNAPVYVIQFLFPYSNWHVFFLGGLDVKTQLCFLIVGLIVRTYKKLGILSKQLCSPKIGSDLYVIFAGVEIQPPEACSPGDEPSVELLLTRVRFWLCLFGELSCKCSCLSVIFVMLFIFLKTVCIFIAATDEEIFDPKIDNGNRIVNASLIHIDELEYYRRWLGWPQLSFDIRRTLECKIWYRLRLLDSACNHIPQLCFRS